MEIPEQYKKNLYRGVLTLLTVLSLFFAVKFLEELKSYQGSGEGQINTIVVSGHGEVQAVPDIASVYFTIRKEGKTVKEAQEAVVAVETKALEALRGKNIENKDIQTSNASFNPKYEYTYDKMVVPCNQFGCAPNPGKSVITGYEAYESITVKVRNVDSVGDVMQALGTVGVTDLNGPNFMIDDEEGMQAQARKEAIEEARAKAKVLARDLEVRLGRISSFSESGGGYPMPYFSKAMVAEDAAAGAPAEIPRGENTISADVTITYEIR